VTVRARCRPSAVGACTGRAAVRAHGRGIGARRFAGLAAGRVRTLRVRHTPSRRRLVVRVTVGDGGGLGVTARRVARRRR
jgi:hypothetical protein